MDVFKMTSSFPPASFDIAIDKGTMDAFLTAYKDDDIWDPSEACVKEMKEYMSNVDHVLKPGGIFIHITWAQPHFRKRFLTSECLEEKVETLTVGDGLEYFVYIVRKKI